MIEYRRWLSGDAPLASPLAFDTETRMIDGPLDVPDLALLTASDGLTHVWVHPDDVAKFLAAHKSHRWYAYNTAFDFWVIGRRSASAASPAE